MYREREREREGEGERDIPVRGGEPITIEYVLETTNAHYRDGLQIPCYLYKPDINMIYHGTKYMIDVSYLQNKFFLLIKRVQYYYYYIPELKT